jgi:hypothetical protein
MQLEGWFFNPIFESQEVSDVFILVEVPVVF